MAHVDTGGSSGRRGARKSLDAAVNLVPYIDLLVTLMTFLMITAAWASYASLTAHTQSGGPGDVDAHAHVPITIDLLESGPRGMDALSGATKDTPIHVRVEDGVHHEELIELLDVIAQKKLAAPTVEPFAGS